MTSTTPRMTRNLERLIKRRLRYQAATGRAANRRAHHRQLRRGLVFPVQFAPLHGRLQIRTTGEPRT